MLGTDSAPSHRRLIERFWQLMASNHFASVREVCSDDLIVDWPQTCERIRGIANFAQLNHDYPAHGLWTFDVQRILVDGSHAVSEVAISDGLQHAYAISFFRIRDGRIQHILEHWPDPGAAPAWRAHLVEAMPGRQP